MNKAFIKEVIKIMGLAISVVFVLNIFFLILSGLNIVDPISYDTDMKELAGYSQNKVTNFISIVLIGPIIEELIYRFLFCGGCYKFLPNTKGKEWIIILVSSVLFGFSHETVEQVIYASVCGCILGYLYFYPLNKGPIVKPNIFRPILFHIVFNSIGYITYLVRS